MKLFIRERIGPRCIIKEDGQKIYDTIYGPLRSGELITLDFEGVKDFE